MRKNLQQCYLATLRKCATPPLLTTPTVTLQPQSHQQTHKQEQQNNKLLAISLSPKRCMLPRSIGLCFDCFHMAAITRFPAYSSRPHSTSTATAKTTTTIATVENVVVVVSAETPAVGTADDIPGVDVANALVTAADVERETTATINTTTVKQRCESEVKLLKAVKIENSRRACAKFCNFFICASIFPYFFYIYVHTYLYVHTYIHTYMLRMRGVGSRTGRKCVSVTFDDIIS